MASPPMWERVFGAGKPSRNWKRFRFLDFHEDSPVNRKAARVRSWRKTCPKKGCIVGSGKHPKVLKNAHMTSAALGHVKKNPHFFPHRIFCPVVVGQFLARVQQFQKPISINVWAPGRVRGLACPGPRLGSQLAEKLHSKRRPNLEAAATKI